MHRVLLKVHLCVGLVAALFLMVLGVTGAAMAFENELNRLVNPSLLTVAPSPNHLAWEELRRRVETARPEWRVQRVYLPEADNLSTYVRLESRTDGHTDEIYLDQHTGAILGQKSGGNQLLWKIHEIHVNLTAGKLGGQFVAASSVALLLLALTGLCVWWPRKVFRFRFGVPPAGMNRDIHRALGFWSSLAMLAFAVTGTNLHIQTGGTLFDIMEDKSVAASHPGHGLTADGMIQAATEAVPAARVMRISFWPGTRPVLVQMRFPEDKTPAGRTSVTLNPKTGEVLKVVSSRTAPWYYTALVEWNREIHTGTIYGAPTKAIAGLFSLLPVVLGGTGIMIWLNKKLAAARGRKAAALRALEPHPVA